MILRSRNTLLWVQHDPLDDCWPARPGSGCDNVAVETGDRFPHSDGPVRQHGLQCDEISACAVGGSAYGDCPVRDSPPAWGRGRAWARARPPCVSRSRQGRQWAVLYNEMVTVGSTLSHFAILCPSAFGPLMREEERDLLDAVGKETGQYERPKQPKEFAVTVWSRSLCQLSLTCSCLAYR